MNFNADLAHSLRADIQALCSGTQRSSRELDARLYNLIGWETIKNGRGWCMRAPGESRWLSLLRPSYDMIDALVLAREGLSGGWRIQLSLPNTRGREDIVVCEMTHPFIGESGIWRSSDTAAAILRAFIEAFINEHGGADGRRVG